MLEQAQKPGEPHWQQLLECLSKLNLAVSRQKVAVGPMEVRNEYAKLVSTERRQCPECSNFYARRHRAHNCIRSLQQMKWPTLGGKVFCLLCMQLRDSKAALARHYLACYSIQDLKTHLGINARLLFFALRPELLAREGDAAREMRAEEAEREEPGTSRVERDEPKSLEAARSGLVPPDNSRGAADLESSAALAGKRRAKAARNRGSTVTQLVRARALFEQY